MRDMISPFYILVKRICKRGDLSIVRWVLRADEVEDRACRVPFVVGTVAVGSLDGVGVACAVADLIERYGALGTGRHHVADTFPVIGGLDEREHLSAIGIDVGIEGD